MAVLKDDRIARVLVEVCVETLDRAMAAERGGANRIELCGDLSSGGVTPAAALMSEVRSKVRIPIHVLVRPQSANDFCSASDFEAMERDIRLAQQIGMDGIVLGVLDERTLQVDRRRTSRLVELAHPLPVTFHRAFDLCPDLPAALDTVIETGAQRILTSGGKLRAADGLAGLGNLVEAARNRILIMPGGGIRATNVQRILRRTQAKEVHTSLVVSNGKQNRVRSVGQNNLARDAAQFEARVRKFTEVIQSAHTVPQHLS